MPVNVPVEEQVSVKEDAPIEDEDILRVVFVTDRNGVDVYTDPSDGSEILGRYAYAAKLEVVAIEGEWMRVKGMGVYDVGEGFIRKKGTGKSTEIRLEAQDLYTVVSASRFDRNGNPEDVDVISNLKIELVDRAAYESKKKEAVDFFLQDTLAFQKKDGVLKLKCAQKTKTFTDKPDAEENMQIFQYVGQIKKLNAYVVFGSYWEDNDFRLIDKTTGQETDPFIDFPYLSADNKHILSLYSNPYEQTGDLSLYTVSGKQQINLILTAGFKNWMPSGESNDEQFWHADGYFYLPVVHSSIFWNEQGNLSESLQFIRIKVL